MKTKIQGTRAYPVEGELRLKELEYGKNPKDGNWYARCPGGHHGNLSSHTVIEHEDGTISVEPSILISTSKDRNPVPVWHGYLRHGVWEEC